MTTRAGTFCVFAVLAWWGAAPGPERELRADEQELFWSFRPVRAVAPPPLNQTGWSQAVIDRFILAMLENHGLEPSAPADRRTLIRRATFELTGLPPTPEEIAEFLADESPEAFAHVVDRLLASPRYGERWGRHWLDVVRYADARDLIQLPAESDFREAWRYRDWVVSAFNRDLPYDEFVAQQVAGDLMQPADRATIDAAALVATGMLAIAEFVPGDTDKEMMIADYVNDQIDVVGRAFLGLTLACARCHDHKFDPISTRDYYSLAGIFFSTRLVPAPVEGNTPLIRVPLLTPAEIAMEEAQQTADNKRKRELERRLSGAAEREYRAYLKRLVLEQTARYLVAACEFKYRAAHEPHLGLLEFGKQHKLHEGWLAGWVEYLQKAAEEQQSMELVAWRRKPHDAADGRLDRAELERSARELERALAVVAIRKEAQATRNQDDAAILRFRADDPRLLTS